MRILGFRGNSDWGFGQGELLFAQNHTLICPENQETPGFAE
jgi:hypothetical protein